jgi:hypothetical protein
VIYPKGAAGMPFNTPPRKGGGLGHADHARAICFYL